MPLKSAVACSENLEDSYSAGLEISQKISEILPLRRHSVGILYCNVQFAFEDLLRGIRHHLDIPVIGCTTASEANSKGYFEESASLMVLTSDDVRFGVGVAENLSANPESATRKACQDAMTTLDAGNVKLAVTFPDTTLKTSTDYVLNLLKRELGENLPIVGGVPGDNFRFQKTYQFLNDKVYSDSIPVLLMSGDIAPVVIARSGWIPTGKQAVATSVSGNLLFEIDDEPAINYLRKYVPTEDDPEILGSYPLAIHLEESESWIIRSPHSYDKDRQCVIYQGDIPENAKVQLAYGTREDILNGAVDAISSLANKRPDCVLMFSCAGRKLMLGLDTSREIELIRRGLPIGTTVNGFYSYGELGPLDSACGDNNSQFHNCTVILCAL